jgi:macrolide-specific efflux system membrane fusion protein
VIAVKKITGKQLGLALLVLAVLLGTGLLVRHIFPREKTTYITAAATPMDLEESVLASGTLHAFKTVDVGAQVSGQLKTLHVALGDKVTRGQLLAEIDPILQQNSLKDAEAQIENLQAQRRSSHALLMQYDLAFKRQNSMVALDAAPRADLESARAQYDNTRYAIASLDAQIKRARIARDTARANLGYTRISAPMDGVVISITTQEGQTLVSTQSATTILSLANLDLITVKAKISEADITRVKPGLITYFTLLGDGDRRYYSRLRTTEPGPVSGSGGGSTSSSTTSSSTAIYYNGLFEVPNPDHKLRVSMTVQAVIVLNEARKALTIPVSALGDKQKDGSYLVKVLRDDTPEPRLIRVGINDRVNVQVIEGLKVGEQVIIGDSSTLPAVDKSAPAGPPPRR